MKLSELIKMMQNIEWKYGDMHINSIKGLEDYSSEKLKFELTKDSPIIGLRSSEIPTTIEVFLD